MAVVEARLKVKGKSYEISVDLDEALKVKAGDGDITAALQSPGVYHDVKKADTVSQGDLEDAFGSTDIFDVARQIIVRGEVQKTQEFRDEARENIIKQVVDLIVRNASDQHGNPFTVDRIRSGISQVHYNFDSRPIEQQMGLVVDLLKEVMPIKVVTKRVKLTVPARFTGSAYGLLKVNKESEEWLANGDLQVIMNIPAGLLIDFYESLNGVTHGAVQAEELDVE